jgi:hypothetical protein
MSDATATAQKGTQQAPADTTKGWWTVAIVTIGTFMLMRHE